MSATATAVDVLMPSLVEGMEEGTIVAWLLEEGAHVVSGEELLEVETDKATATVEATASGALHIIVPVGGTARVGDPIARLGAGDEPAPPADRSPAAPVAVPAAPVPADAGGTAPARSEPVPATHGDVRASPLARRVASEHSVALDSVAGTGPGGRILRADVERAAGIAPVTPTRAEAQAPEPGASAEAAPPTRSGGAKGDVTVEHLTRLQQVVARRMSQSKATAPEFVLGVDVDMEEAISLRTQLKALAGEEKPPSFNDFIVKACALALRDYPRANGAYNDGSFELFGAINVGVAVAANDALVVPTIFDADRKSFGEIGRESRRLAQRVREGTVTPPELAGGTFTVSNLGMFGITEFIAVINPPQAAILSVGEMRRQPAEHDGQIALRHIVKLKLTCDHRILYGADAAGFLMRIRELLQTPLTMIL